MSVTLRLVLVLSLSLAAPAGAMGAPRAVSFLFSGAVELPGGKPVRGARITLDGVGGVEAVTDAAGSYSFTRFEPDVAALAGRPLRLVLRASHKGWRLALPTGTTSLALELSVTRATDGTERLEVRASEDWLARQVVEAFAGGGDVTVDLHADFMRQLGPEDRSAPALDVFLSFDLSKQSGASSRTATATATAPDSVPAGDVPADRSVAEPTTPTPAPAGARPERPESMRLFPSPPPPGTLPRPEPGTTPAPTRLEGTERPSKPGPAVKHEPGPAEVVARPGIRVSVRPDTSAAARDTMRRAGRDSGPGGPLRVAHGRAMPETPPPPADAAECRCSVRGTVEVRSDEPLAGTLRVVVSLADIPAQRDTVELYMGPPRPFDLGSAPCGAHRLEVRPLSARRFALVPPGSGTFDCAAGRARQLRVVLVPR